MSYFKPSELWKEVYKNTSPLVQHCLIFGQIIKRILMGTSQLKLEAFRRAVVTQCLAVETKPHYVLSLKWHLSEVRAELKDGFCFVLEGNKLPGPSATSVCSSSSSGILPPHSQMREQWILISSRFLYSINSFAFDSQYLPFSLCWPFSLFPRFINMGKNRKLNWTWKKTVIEFGLCYVEFLLDLFLPLKIAMCSSGVSEGSRLLQSFVPPCGEGGDTHRKTALINGTSKAVVIYQTRSIY